MALANDKQRLLRQGETLRRIREARTDITGRKVSQRDAASILQLKEDTYRSYEYGRAELPEAHAVKLAAAWDIPWRTFYESGANPPYTEGSDVSGPRVPIPQFLVPIPYVGKVGANHKADWFDPMEVHETIDVPNEMATPKGPGSLRFACTVVGDSCFDLLWPDDEAVFHKHNVPKLNHMMLFRSDDNLVTIKQMKHDGRGFILHPLNQSYDDQPAMGTVVGFLVGIIRKMGSKKVTVYDEYGILP